MLVHHIHDVVVVLMLCTHQSLVGLPLYILAYIHVLALYTLHGQA